MKNETRKVQLGTLFIIIGIIINLPLAMSYSGRTELLLVVGSVFSLTGAYFIISERIRMKETKKLRSTLFPLSIMIAMLVIYFVFINKENMIQ